MDGQNNEFNSENIKPVLAIQAKQVYGKADNSNNNSTLVNQIRKSDNIIDIIPKDKKFNVV